ncbi:MAG: CPBP family intramembrane metalloprotease [Planctomycetes bacterium]|nr:CPBP family intramembrane metalloprotease [Planctomycetota bacterium]
MNGWSEPFLAVLRTELLGLARDRRALFSAIVLPVLLYPVLFFGQRWLERVSKETLEAKTVAIAVDLSRATAGTSARLRELLEQEGPLQFTDFDAEALQALEPELAKGSVEAYDREAALARRAFEAGADVLVAAIAIDEPPGLELRAWYDGARDLSNEGRQRVDRALERLYDEELQKRVEERIGPDPGRGLAPRAVDVASAEDQSGAALGRLLPLIAVLVLLSGGSYAALSTFAGEREGGTLETLLVQPVRSDVIAAAKFAAVLLTALATFVVNAGSILASTALGFGGLPGVGGPDGLGGLGGPGGAGLALGAGRLLSAAFVFLPAAVLLCAVLCLVCGRARTFREGQNLLLPLMLVSLVPTLIATQQDVRLDLLLAAIPLAGPALCMRDALRGELAPGLVAWMFAANTGWAALALARIGRVLDAERVLSTAGDENEDARRAVQSRTALRWAVACVFAIYLAGGALQAWALVPGLVLTLAVIVPLFAWLSARGTARRAKERLAATLQLGAPRAAHVAGAVLLAPALYQIATRLFAWQESVIPLPVDSGTETLTRQLEGLPLAAQLALLALLPAFGEELFFRGALFGGLRRDLALWKCALWEFVLFGAAHASIYRVLPTGMLGAVLTLLAARTRSLWPCVLLHATYNALAVLAGTRPELARPELAWLALPGLALLLGRPHPRPSSP